MKEIINFIVDNWQFVSSVAISIVGFILLLLRKRYKIVDSVCEYLGSIIPQAVRYTESHCSEKCLAKKRFCISYIKSLFDKHFPGCNWSNYESYVSYLIEDVLDTPQKKVK